MLVHMVDHGHVLPQTYTASHCLTLPLIIIFPLSLYYCRHNAKPRLEIQKRENTDIALEFMKKIEKIRLENIGEITVYSNKHNTVTMYSSVWCAP